MSLLFTATVQQDHPHQSDLYFYLLRLDRFVMQPLINRERFDKNMQHKFKLSKVNHCPESALQLFNDGTLDLYVSRSFWSAGKEFQLCDDDKKMQTV